jgi:hypothetical protein
MSVAASITFHLVVHNLTRVEFEALTAVVTKSSIFWDVTPCSTLQSLNIIH